MKRYMGKIVGLAVLALLAMACAAESAVDSQTSPETEANNTSGASGAESEAPLAIVVNSAGTLVPGEVRLLVALLDPEGLPVAAPDVAAVVELLDPQTGESVSLVDADFVWMIPDVRGIYVAHVDIDRVGVWGVVVRADGHVPSQVAGVQISDTALIPVVGDAAPRSVTPTGAQFDLAEISTAPDPIAAFYESSLHEVLGGGDPVVVVFATPALCTSATCGPMLEVVEEVFAEVEDVEFVHVEVYTNLQDLSSGELELAPAILEWGLPSEPWVFVVDGAGTVTAAFEGALADSELTASIEAAR